MPTQLTLDRFQFFKPKPSSGVSETLENIENDHPQRTNKVKPLDKATTPAKDHSACCDPQPPTGRGKRPRLKESAPCGPSTANKPDRAPLQPVEQHDAGGSAVQGGEDTPAPAAGMAPGDNCKVSVDDQKHHQECKMQQDYDRQQQAGERHQLECEGQQRDSGSGSSSEEEEEQGPNQYELEREARIRRNQAVLAAMGLAQDIAELSKQQQGKHKKRQASGGGARRKCVATDAAAQLPARATRSSARMASAAAGGEYSGAANGAPSLEERQRKQQQQEPECFQPSELSTYIVSDRSEVEEVGGSRSAARGSSQGACSDEQRVSPDSRACGFSQLRCYLSCGALQRVYSMDHYGQLVVAGGKDGYAAVFGCRDIQALEASALPGAVVELEPLLLAKLHRGWISDVQLVRGAGNGNAGGDGGEGGSVGSGGGGGGDGNGALLLLSASNDGTVALWDARVAELSRGGAATGMPRRLWEESGLHSSGIFSLHEQCGSLLTSSKDGTVAVAALPPAGGSGVQAVRTYCELHDGAVVKAARWAPGGAAHIFASAGNDRSICIVDTRVPGDTPSLHLEGAHASAVNCVRWNAGSAASAAPHQLLSAGGDPHIHVWDVRQPGAAQFTLTGHIAGSRSSAIYQPSFACGGSAVATGGDKSNCLSLYCLRTGGDVISRGRIDFNPTATHCSGQAMDSPLLCATNRAIALFRPLWSAAPTSADRRSS